MYKVILPEQLPNPSQYKWFGSFANPCYGFDVKVDVTKLIAHGKAHAEFLAGQAPVIELDPAKNAETLPDEPKSEPLPTSDAAPAETAETETTKTE